MISRDQLRATVVQVGADRRPVLVHSSLRSFGEPVEGGADGLVDALLEAGSTVLVPTFTWERFAGFLPPAELVPARDAFDPTRRAPGPGDLREDWFSPEDRLTDASMGAVPAAVLARADMVRGRHPLCSFAAVGPLADALVDGQGPDDVYAPIRAAADAGGVTLLVGVGLTRMTTIHAAEQVAGRRLLVRWARVPGGRIAAVETGGCSDGFDALAPTLEPLARRARVGASEWAAYDLASTLDAAARAIRADPAVTRCPAACDQCEDLVAGGPVGEVPLG